MFPVAALRAGFSVSPSLDPGIDFETKAVGPEVHILSLAFKALPILAENRLLQRTVPSPKSYTPRSVSLKSHSCPAECSSHR